MSSKAIAIPEDVNLPSSSLLAKWPVFAGVGVVGLGAIGSLVARAGLAGQEPVDSGNGVVVAGEGAYAYVERADDRLVLVVASDPAVGGAVRDLVATG